MKTHTLALRKFNHFSIGRVCSRLKACLLIASKNVVIRKNAAARLSFGTCRIAEYYGNSLLEGFVTNLSARQPWFLFCICLFYSFARELVKDTSNRT